jgi:type I restriction enzyme S subunit
MVDKTIGDLCNVIGGKPAPVEECAFENGTVPFLRMRDLGAYHLTNNLTEIRDKLNVEYVKKKNLTPVRKGALLMPRSGSVGLNHRAILGVDAVIVSHVCALEILNEQILDKEYFYYYMSTVDMSNITKKTTGLDAITFEDLRKIRIPTPNIQTQKTIAKTLKEVDKARERRKAANALTDQFLQSSFLSLFGDLVVNDKKFPIKRLDEIADVSSGVTKGRNLNGAELISVPYMRVANVQDGHLNLSEIKEIEIREYELEKYLLKAGDILLTEGGDPDKLGRGAVWYNQISNCIHQNHIFKVRPDKNKFASEFLSYQFASAYGKRYFFKAAKQTTGIASINSTQLKAFPVVVPPLSLQQKFAAIVAQAETLRKKQQENEQELEQLFQALLQKYFG